MGLFHCDSVLRGDPTQQSVDGLSKKNDGRATGRSEINRIFDCSPAGFVPEPGDWSGARPLRDRRAGAANAAVWFTCKLDVGDVGSPQPQAKSIP